MALNLSELKNIAEFKNIDKAQLAEHVISTQEVRHLFELCDALWIHSGDSMAPHAELTSGKCSNGFIDSLRALRYSYLCQFLAEQLVKKLRSNLPILHPDWVIGSDHAGATFSYAVALALQAQHDFTEKGEGKTQSWKRFEIHEEETVLQVEELITTTTTLKAVREGIRADNPSPVMFAPIILALIHRSSLYEFEGSPILFLAHFDIETWEQAECPLCKNGSERVRPKQHWKELTKK